MPTTDRPEARVVQDGLGVLDMRRYLWEKSQHGG